MQANATSIGTYPVDSVIGEFLRVKVLAGVLALADSDDVEVGTMSQASVIEGLGKSSVGSVVFQNAPGTRYVIASEAIAAWATVFKAAGGKVAASGTDVYGVAHSVATADGDVIEVQPT